MRMMIRSFVLSAVTLVVFLSAGEARAVCVGSECYIRMTSFALNPTTWYNEDQIQAIAETEIEALNACRQDIDCGAGCEELVNSGAFDCGGCPETSNPQGCSIQDSGIINDDGTYYAFAEAAGTCGCQCGDGWPMMMSVAPKPGRGGGS